MSPDSDDVLPVSVGRLVFAKYLLLELPERIRFRLEPDGGAAHESKAMIQNTFVTTKYSTPSQVVPLVMPFPKLSLEPL